MPAWWESPETVGTIATWTLWAGVTCGALAALLAVVSNVARVQRDRLLDLPNRLAIAEGRLTPRRFTGEQRARLVTLIRQTPGGQVAVNAVANDAEAWAVAEQFKAIFAEAGMESQPIRGLLVSGVLTDVRLVVRSEQTAPPWAGAFQATLIAMGWPAAGEIAPNVEEGQLTINVGSKPLPPAK